MAPAGAQDPPGRGVGIRLVDVPAGNAGDPRAQQYVVDEVDPGTSFSRRIELINETDAPIELAVYATAADIPRRGGFAIADGRTDNELTGWIAVEPHRVQLEPDGSAMVTATFAVPDDAVGGERYAAVVAELVGEPADAGGLQVVSRLAIRAYLFVAGDTRPRFAGRIEAIEASTATDGRWKLHALIANTGSRALDLTGEARLDRSDQQLVAGPYAAEPGGLTLAPDDRGRLPFDIGPPLPVPDWEATVIAWSGDDLELTASGSVDFRGSVADTTRCGWWCWIAGLLLVATATGLTAEALARRRRGIPVLP